MSVNYINNADEIIGFHLTNEPHGCFSNWHRSEFVYAGIEYNCVEQYMMAQKVALGRRYDLYEKIMKTNDPARMKSLAGKDHYPKFVNIKAMWDKNCRNIVKRGVKAKFQQNLHMMNELFETGNALIAECAGQDRIWGIGINLQDSLWKDTNNWNGSNYLGIILMEVRDKLRKEQDDYGVVQYIDYRDAVPIKECRMPIGQLRRIPQYYSAIHAYDNIGILAEAAADDGNLKKIRNCGKKSIQEIMEHLFLFQYDSFNQKRRERYISEVVALNAERNQRK